MLTLNMNHLDTEAHSSYVYAITVAMLFFKFRN
jgi:hypothetical protein